ncbi:MAG TPA: TetR/AcrR family transcriptional regulator, partial [Epsilonproteobacteria bacterium]|nr:TetR/AcrR family transcriptional regulator [Campylobacterota bacterium]
MTKKIQKRDAEASRKLIVKNAIALFSKKGYAGASME